METFHKLFGSLLGFVYHCFDRIVIQGYLPLLTRAAHIVHFCRDVESMQLSGGPLVCWSWTSARVSSAVEEHRCAGRSPWSRKSSRDSQSSTTSRPSPGTNGLPPPRWG